ncbi:MAG TPA: hypothetical protein VM914_12365 [Pyrinomonadaceae bacterium]|jgi:hypothetical protein|nr:hypothetical protein [Pyrinomonadaceae bacterium]
MRVVLKSVLFCALCLLACSVAQAQKSSGQKTFHTEGVFGNITAGEGGDYGGMQVYLTDSDGQFYATVTIAQGVLLPPVLVKVKAEVETRKIEFELPGGDAPRKFKGTVTAEGLTLTEDGEKMFLKRKCLD